MQRLHYLLNLYAANQATQAEIREMLDLLKEEGGDEALEQLMGELRVDRFSEDEVDWERIWENIREGADTLPVLGEGAEMSVNGEGRRINKWWMMAAVGIFLLAGLGLYKWWAPDRAPVEQAKTVTPSGASDILPGGNKAILTLSGGQQIVLDSASNGTLAMQGSTSVTKLAGGHLAYSYQASSTDTATVYNTMSTPIGGQYRLSLPDGTEVWLNASSSIHFPTMFKGNERVVEVQGEAYFQVVKDPLHPFHVVARGTDITVLGTSFNVDAYADEPSMKTTLVDGSIRVRHDAVSLLMTPGQQAAIGTESKIRLSEADLDETLAWKQGYFSFRETELHEIMRQMTRWYDVEVEFSPGLPDRYFTADVSMAKPLSSFLKVLEMGGVRYKLEGKKLVIL